MSSLATFPPPLTSLRELETIPVALLAIQALRPPESKSLASTFIPGKLTNEIKGGKKKLYIEAHYTKDWDSFLPPILNTFRLCP